MCAALTAFPSCTIQVSLLTGKIMPQHETKTCPRCARKFECKAGNIAACQCSKVSLTYEERVYIEGKHLDCLCEQCLQALQFEYKLYRNHIFRF